MSSSLRLLLLSTLVVQIQTAVLCGNQTNLHPRIKCPDNINLPASADTCDAVVTWEDSEYFPSPFYSTGVDSDKQLLNQGDFDPHYSFTFNDRPEYYTPEVKPDNFPNAECNTIGATLNIFGRILFIFKL